MSTLKERIEELMRASGMDERALAKAAGVTPSAVYQWLGGGAKPIHSIGDIEAATKLTDATGYCALWIAKGKGPKFQFKSNSGTARVTGEPPPEYLHTILQDDTKPKMAPVIDWASLGVALSLSKDNFRDNPQISMPAEANDYCKWVIADSDAHRFRIRKGDKIALDPLIERHQPEEGGLYLFRNLKGSFFVGEYRSLAGDEFEAIGPDGSALESRRHGITIAAIIRGTWR